MSTPQSHDMGCKHLDELNAARKELATDMRRGQPMVEVVMELRERVKALEGALRGCIDAENQEEYEQRADFARALLPAQPERASFPLTADNATNPPAQDKKGG